jgi:diguanylate cyclase (GGDEF)-like protein
MERLVPYTTCAFFVDDGEDNVQAIHVSGKFSEAIQGHKMSMGKGISGWVAAYRRPMINTGPALDFQGITGDFSTFKDALVVPISFDDESLGTISLYAQEPIIYTQHELSILQTLSSFIAPLISDAKKHGAASSEHFTDPITQIHRVSYLTAIGPQLISFASRNRAPVSLIYLGIRNLSQIVRVYGDAVGNSVLKRISESIKPELRETDILVRYGHQGFIAFLPGVRDNQALRCVQRLRQQIKNNGLTVSGQTVQVECRTGIASYPKDGATIFALIQSAQENIVNADSEAIESNVVDFLPRA